MRKFWTAEEKELIKIHYPDNRTEDILYLFPDRTIEKVMARANLMGIKKSEAFFKSPQSGRISKENDIGVNTRYKKNCPGWNKGKKQTDYMKPEMIARTAKTRFKKGQDPHNTVSLGYERITKDGYVEVKVRHVKDGTANNKNFELKHRLMWIENFGPIPKGVNVEFVAGADRVNFQPSDLVLRTKKENLLKNTMCDKSIVKRFLRIKEPEMVDAIITEMPEVIDLKRKTIVLNQKIKKHAKSS